MTWSAQPLCGTEVQARTLTFMFLARSGAKQPDVITSGLMHASVFRAVRRIYEKTSVIVTFR